MRPFRITFTGVDEMTDLVELSKVQKHWPIAEFGVLTSYNAAENGNRFPGKERIDELARLNLNLSLHVCGKATADAAAGKWDNINKLVSPENGKGNLGAFRRIQLNIVGRDDIPVFCFPPRYSWQEIIIQARNADDNERYNASRGKWTECREQFSILLDGSGGRGLETKLEILPTDGKVGYAGGFSPENINAKLEFLMENVKAGMFWIDMESRVRTDDWFDLGKVVEVLEAYDHMVKKH